MGTLKLITKLFLSSLKTQNSFHCFKDIKITVMHGSRFFLKVGGGGGLLLITLSVSKEGRGKFSVILLCENKIEFSANKCIYIAEFQMLTVLVNPEIVSLAGFWTLWLLTNSEILFQWIVINPIFCALKNYILHSHWNKCSCSN